MKLELEIDEKEIRELVVNRLADKLVSQIWENHDYDSNLSYDQQKAAARKNRQEILAKIDWKNAGSQLSETVVQKFFMKLLDK